MKVATYNLLSLHVLFLTLPSPQPKVRSPNLTLHRRSRPEHALQPVGPEPEVLQVQLPCNLPPPPLPPLRLLLVHTGIHRPIVVRVRRGAYI